MIYGYLFAIVINIFYRSQISRNFKSLHITVWNKYVQKIEYIHTARYATHITHGCIGK